MMLKCILSATKGKHYKELINIKGYLESNEQVKINYSFNINYFIE